jgi:long-chain fatty acid transport protein
MEYNMRLLFRFSLLSIVLVSFTFAQTGTRLVDFNAKSLGRGGTSIGIFDSPELMMTNPAGLSFLNNTMIDADFSLMIPELQFTNNLNDAKGETNVFPLPALSFVKKYQQSRWTWGAGFFTAGGMGADFKLKNALYGSELQAYHSMLASLQGGLSVAYGFSDKFSVGISAHLVYSMLEFSMPYALNPSIMQGVANNTGGMTFGQIFAAPPAFHGFGYTEVIASAKMSDLVGIGFNGKIGLAYKINDKLSFGLSYTMPTSLTYKNGKATMDMTAQMNDAFGKAVQGYLMQNPGQTPQQAQAAVMAQFAGMGIDLSKGVQANYDLNLDLKFPQSVGFGTSFSAMDNLKFAVDVEWINWTNAFDKMTLKLSNGTNSNINTMLGNSGSFNLDFPMNWKNAVVVKLGLEYNVDQDLTMRLGYAYGNNPVPQSTIFPVFPAIVENHFMIGGSLRVSAPLTIHAALELGLNNSETSNNPSLIANEYSGSSSQLATTLLHFAATYAF